MSEYDVLINKYDALNAGYDQLYPKPMKHANTHASGGTDPITPSDIGAYSKNEIDTLLANKLGGVESTEYPGCYYRMVGGVVEWFNPPMMLGGVDADGNPINEYRTTERYMGKPVYVKLVDCGLMVNGKKQVTHGVANCDYVIRYMGCTGKEAMPRVLNKSLDDTWASYFGKVTPTEIEMYGGAGSAGEQIYCTMWYTKTTD